VIDQNTITLIAVVLGVVLRTALPFIKKINSGEQITFDSMYIKTALAAIVTSYSTMLGFVAANPLITDVILLALIAFFVGYGENELVNFVVSMYGMWRTGQPDETPEPETGGET